MSNKIAKTALYDFTDLCTLNYYKVSVENYQFNGANGIFKCSINILPCQILKTTTKRKSYYGNRGNFETNR